MIDDLSEVKPEYTAILTFTDEGGDLRLSVDWQETQDYSAQSTDFVRKATKWTRLDRDTGAPSPIFDVSLTDLNTGSAWQFDIVAAQSIEESRLPQQLVRFAEKLAIDTNAARKRSADRLFVVHTPHANLKSLQQRISYHYRIAIGNSDYTLELSQFQDRVYAARQAPAPSFINSAAGLTIYEPRWSLNVFRADWDTNFAQNERLEIGAMVVWSDDVESWFPQDLNANGSTSTNDDEKPDAEVGWKQLMEKLVRIEALVQGANPSNSVEDLLGGMTIG